MDQALLKLKDHVAALNASRVLGSEHHAAKSCNEPALRGLRSAIILCLFFAVIFKPRLVLTGLGLVAEIVHSPRDDRPKYVTSALLLLPSQCLHRRTPLRSLCTSFLTYSS
jgi:hypothetical protein